MSIFKRKHKKPKLLPLYPTTRPYESYPSGRRQLPIPDRIGRYHIPLSVLEATDRAMRRFGSEQRECYVWWGGYFTASGDAQVLTAICPEFPTEFGRIHLSHEQLTKLHSTLRTLDQVLLIELHTHPYGGNGQNSVDAAHPAATYNGFISVVVPDFAFPHFYDLRTTYFYQYRGNCEWRQLDSAEVEHRFVVEETFVSVEV